MSSSPLSTNVDETLDLSQSVSATIRTSGLTATSMLAYTDDNTSLSDINYSVEVSNDFKN